LQGQSALERELVEGSAIEQTHKARDLRRLGGQGCQPILGKAAKAELIRIQVEDQLDDRLVG
jgi:hypothetical protein